MSNAPGSSAPAVPGLAAAATGPLEWRLREIVDDFHHGSVFDFEFLDSPLPGPVPIDSSLAEWIVPLGPLRRRYHLRCHCAADDDSLGAPEFDAGLPGPDLPPDVAIVPRFVPTELPKDPHS